MKNITIAYVNFWDEKRDLFYEIIKHNLNVNIKKVKFTENPFFLIASVNGNINKVKGIRAKYKIFYTGENTGRSNYKQYNDKNLYETFDLIIGFKKTDLSKKQINFPIWLYMWSRDKKIYNYNEEYNILKDIEKNNIQNLKKKKNMFATMVSTHDCDNIRSKICDEVGKYGKIMYPSKFRNNTQQIPDTGNRWSDKINYISNSIYNVCPENSKGEGYFTEKIFNAFEAGTIPIYWAVNYPEPNIINKNRLFMVDFDNIHTINDVIINIDKYTKESLWLDGSHKYLENLYNTLIEKFKELIFT